MSDPPAQSQFSTSSQAVKVFICYSQEDEKWRKALEAHLATLQNQGKILTWHDRAIEAGSEWAAEIKAHLDSAQVILLLISSDAIASTLYDEQMQWAIERHQAGKARVIPIILRPVDWEGTPFSHLTVLPTDGKPVTTWENPDVAFLNVAQEIRRVVDRLAAGTPIADLDQQDCPYRGLFAFREEDAALFFGRDRYIEDLVQRVKTKPLVAVVGASGSGKSSLVFAGLLPKLSANWQVYFLRPGSPDKRPFHNLAAALFPLPSEGDLADQLLRRNQQAEALQQGKLQLQDVIAELTRQNHTLERVLLVIDQFEELYTLCPESERQPFIDVLLAGVQQDDRCKVVLTLRADFCAQAYAYRPLLDALQDADLKLGSMNQEELKSAIEQPAAIQRVQLEAGLTDRILNDVSQEPGHLPLLEFTLTQLWDRQKQQMLTHQGYEVIGGVKKALATHAETVYSNLNDQEKEQAKYIFLQLVQLNEDAGDTRRLATRAEIGQDNWHLVTQLASDRLIVTGRNEQTGEETVEVVHEALIREWQRFRDWIVNNRNQLYQKRRIEAAANEWKNQKRSKEYLWQGRQLADAKRFNQQQTAQLALSQLAKEFIQTSFRQRQWNQLKTASWLIVPALVVMGLVEPNLREASIRDDFARLAQASNYGKKPSVEALVQGCDAQQQLEWLVPSYLTEHVFVYLTERLFGNCRSLDQAPLTNADLSNADLSNAYLSNADLSNANLSNADLHHAHLDNADLGNINLNNADLTGGWLHSANLSSARLISARLISADLSQVNLSSANLSGRANLGRANLHDANLSSADLSYADLRDTDLSSAVLVYADLSYADLSYANLRYATLSYADLRDTDLSSANLISADLRDTDLSSAILKNTILLNANLSRSRGLQQNQLTGSETPLLCATKLLPEMADLSNRDCDQLPQVLLDRYPWQFKNLEEAKQWVEEQRKQPQ